MEGGWVEEGWELDTLKIDKLQKANTCPVILQRWDNEIREQLGLYPAQIITIVTPARLKEATEKAANLQETIGWEKLL